MNRLLMTAMLLLCSTSPSVHGEAEPPTAEQIRQWVGELGADRFNQRDQATRNLVAAGSDAIEPLMQELSRHGLEVTTRGINILQQLAVAGDEPTEQAARQALEQLAAARVTAAARHARDALDKLDALRQQRAIQELERLGAVVDRQHVELLLAGGPFFAVEINRDWRGTVEDLRWLTLLKDVEQVSLVGPAVTDDWLKYLEGLNSVIVVKIKRASITDAGLASLAGLERLQHVKLLYMDIGDDCVKHLARCRRVMSLHVFGSRITADGGDALREALAAKIDIRRGAFLGISPTAAENVDWAVLQVTPGSAAEAAGLQPNDVIVSYDGKPVGSFVALTSLIAEHDAGQTVSLQIRRSGQLLDRQITLGEWD